MARYVDRLPLATPMAMSDLNDLAFDEILDRSPGIGRCTGLRPQHPPAGSLRGGAVGEPASGGDAEEQLPDPAAAVLARQRARGRRHSGRARLSQRLGATEAGRRTRAAGARVRCPRPAHPGGQRRSCFRGDDPAIGDHPLRHHHQGPVERPADRRCDRPHTRRRRTGTPDHQTPCGRVLEGWRHGRRGEAVPSREHRKDRRLGRFRVGQARHPLYPAWPGDDRARPEAQCDDHRAPGVRRRRDDARGGAAPPPSTSAWPTRRAVPTPGSSTC